MTLYDKIKQVYPELSDDDFRFDTGCVVLCNDGDGQGDYIFKWEYDQPIPEGLSLGKPSA